MASGALSTRPQEESVPAQGRFDDFIEKRLLQTRRQVRLVDVGSGMIVLTAASLLFFLAVAVADHWIFPHGLGFAVRFLLWAGWVGVAGWFAWRWVAPSIVHRINPVFAAQAIEHGRPALKNSLINFLLLRSHPDEVAPVVYRAMEHRAASDLSRVPVEHAVDHHRLIHLCYVLAGAVALFALYLAFSPKNPLTSAARVLWPWSSLPAPTRVHIEDVQPGNAVVFQGNRQPITAHVSGLRNGEEVSLLLTTADEQLVDDRIPMTRTGEDDLYSCELPPGTRGDGSSGGMQQDTLYRITAGDATTPQYKLEVQIAPTIIVDQVDYDYPPYTGLPHRTVKGQGDIKALEGTKVTIHSTANLPIKDANIDLGCTGLQPLTMKHSGKHASGDFTLALSPTQDSTQSWRPLYDRYQLFFTDSAFNGDDRKIQQHPIQYRIDVDRDYPPEIRIDEPRDETAAVPENGQVRIQVHASDDFGLRKVAIHAERNGQPLNLPVLLDRLCLSRHLRNRTTTTTTSAQRIWDYTKATKSSIGPKRRTTRSRSRTTAKPRSGRSASWMIRRAAKLNKTKSSKAAATRDSPTRSSSRAKTAKVRPNPVRKARTRDRITAHLATRRLPTAKAASREGRKKRRRTARAIRTGLTRRTAKTDHHPIPTAVIKPTRTPPRAAGRTNISIKGRRLPTPLKSR